MDEIRIQKLEVFAKHGVLPEENILGQKFLINAVIYTDFSHAAKNDDIDKAINYADVCVMIHTFMQSHTFKLIETVAEELAQHLLQIEGVRALDLEVMKPWAPIGLSVESVSVRVRRKWNEAYLSIGSNMGDKKAYLNGAVCKLQNHPQIRLLGQSQWIETEPYGGVEQDVFLNGALQIETILSPHELLLTLQDMEREAGRVRTIHWGPRTLDLDIIFYEKEVIGENDLAIPHPDMENRVFVLEPLAQINGNLRHPISGLTVTQLLQQLKDRE